VVASSMGGQRESPTSCSAMYQPGAAAHLSSVLSELGGEPGCAHVGARGPARQAHDAEEFAVVLLDVSNAGMDLGFEAARLIHSIRASEDPHHQLRHIVGTPTWTTSRATRSGVAYDVPIPVSGDPARNVAVLVELYCKLPSCAS